MSTEHQGIVFKKSLGTYFVNNNGRIVVCAVSSTLRKTLVYSPRDPNSLPYYRVEAVEDIRTVDPVAIGDVVVYREGINDGGETTDRTNMIIEVLPRRNELTRTSPDQRKLRQVIVANIDQLVAVTAAAKPVPDLVLLDRYLVSAAANDIPAIVCFTKFDQKVKDYVLQAIEDYRKIGYRVIVTSSADGTGVDEFREAITGRVSALMGVSGVGKTSLLNAVEPGLGLRVNAVNQRTGEGRHTTTHLEMFSLAAGGGIVDTPGMREFTLYDIEPEDLPLLFPEMEPLVNKCKFGARCEHLHEPGCAIKAAVEAGEVPESRYRSYVKIMASV